MGRELLGSADVGDDALAAIVADLLGEDEVTLIDVGVEVVDYALPAITTGGRWWISGHARCSRGTRPFRIFVKLVQNWSRSPHFAFVPEHLREMAAASVPWRSEASVYRSDLADRLPDGLSMPRPLAVIDLDELSTAIWLEVVPEHAWPWDTARYRRAGYLLGRLAGSQRVAPLAQIDDHQWSVRDYLHGRFEHQVVPMLQDRDLWAHPVLAGAYGDELHQRMLDAADQVPAWVDELATAPHLPGHGDACPNNLLGAERADQFVLIDFGFWKPLPLGFDLGQLLLGDVQLGHRTSDDLAALDTEIASAYVDGLAAEARPTALADVERLHALQMTVFSGLSSMPVEHLAAAPDAALTRLAATRAAITSYCLDRVDATSATTSP